MNRLDLLLVNAPSRNKVYQDLAELSAAEPPVWAGLIATYCLNQGFTVQILDAEALGLNIEDTAIEVMSWNPHLAVFCIYGHQPSASTQCLPAASAVAAIVAEAEASVRVKTLALGTHPSALPAKTLNEEPFDYVCQGEGPITIVALLKQLKAFVAQDYLSTASISKIPGLWRKLMVEGNPSIWQDSPPPPNIENLSTNLPEQAWHLLDMKRYRAHNWHLWTGDKDGGYASIQTSLNCVFSCQFCCISAPFGDRAMRFWSPNSVVSQIYTLVEQYGITNIKIPDEMFCLNRQHVKAICKGLVASNLGNRLNMWAYARADTVKDEEMLSLLREAGFRWLGIGIESASKHVRDGVEKGRFGNEEIIAAVRRVQSSGLAVAANYIFGLPDDTEESMQQTLDLACEINAEMANFYCAMAYPGSPLHKTARDKGWPLPEDDPTVGWLGYSQHSFKTLPLPTETLTAQQVLDFRDDSFLHYFSRPEYLSMVTDKFGITAEDEVYKMLLKGRPHRKHRG